MANSCKIKNFYTLMPLPQYLTKTTPAPPPTLKFLAPPPQGPIYQKYPPFTTFPPRPAPQPLRGSGKKQINLILTTKSV